MLNYDPQTVAKMIGENISRIRTERGMLDIDIARESEMSDMTVFKWRHGRHNAMGIVTLLRLSDALGVPAAALLAGLQERGKDDESA